MNDEAPRTDVVTREKRRAELGETQFATGTQGGALMQPRNGKELMDMANLMSASGQMVRDFYRGNPGDCAALIMICQPYGFNPFMASWKTYKASKSADAPISFEGQLVNAMVNQSAPVRGRLKYSYDGEGPTRRCTVTGVDRETGDDITYTSPMLKDIKVKNSPLWQADPDQQLGYFSARSWARRHFPELLLGVYTREEIEEAPPRDVTPREPGGFTAKAVAAKAATALPEANWKSAETDNYIEAVGTAPNEIIAELPMKEVAPHWTDGIVWEDAFPGSKEWDEGVAAYGTLALTECPHQDSPAKAADWIGGYHSARKASQ